LVRATSTTEVGLHGISRTRTSHGGLSSATTPDPSFRGKIKIDIAPTILESVGLPEPKRVNGVDQMPIEGVSMLWWSGTRHGLDRVTDAAKEFGPFEKDVWELYDIRNDFGLGTDLSAEHPNKLREFQELFDREARKHNIYPMANSCYELLAADRPKLVSGNTASFTSGTVRLPEEAIIDIKNRSSCIVAFTFTGTLKKVTVQTESK